MRRPAATDEGPASSGAGGAFFDVSKGMLAMVLANMRHWPRAEALRRLVYGRLRGLPACRSRPAPP